MPKFDTSLLPAEPNLDFEETLWGCGDRWVAGVDEAGRGPLAGPVAAAAAILPPDRQVYLRLRGVRDSKQMSADEREYWAAQLKTILLAYGIGFASSEEIYALGIVPATQLAVQRAVEALPLTPEHLLVDFLKLPGLPIPQTPLVKGDSRSLSIASASVLAKTARDALLCDLDRQYPGYGFARHKGYGTRAHLDALQRLGPCPIHRRSFQPVAECQERLKEFNREVIS